MQARVLSVVIDEAHVVSHWGSDFRKAYDTLGMFKALFPKGTPFVAMSATLPARVRDDVLNKLQFDRNAYEHVNEGNDRPNVSIVVRPMHHAMNTYRDLKFVIPEDFKDVNEVKKTFIYADTIAEAADIEEYLYSLCPAELRATGFIRPYSAAFPQKYRDIAMDKFKKGEIRVLICTDAAGMVSEREYHRRLDVDPHLSGVQSPRYRRCCAVETDLDDLVVRTQSRQGGEALGSHWPCRAASREIGV